MTSKLSRILTDLVDLGGPGSGNWGHAGRPGKMGGSAPRTGGGGGGEKVVHGSRAKAMPDDGRAELIASLQRSYPRTQVSVENPDPNLPLLEHPSVARRVGAALENGPLRTPEEYERPIEKDVVNYLTANPNMQVTLQHERVTVTFRPLGSNFDFGNVIARTTKRDPSMFDQQQRTPQEDYYINGVLYAGGAMTSKLSRILTDLVDLGGPGSGNWGHAGRPGKMGGSAPRTGGGGVGVQHANKTVRDAAATQVVTNNEAFAEAVRTKFIYDEKEAERDFPQIMRLGEAGFQAGWLPEENFIDPIAEVSSHRVSNILGLDVVPQTERLAWYKPYERKLSRGIVQAIVPNGEDAVDTKKTAKEVLDRNPNALQQASAILVMDYITGNAFRPATDWQIDGKNRLWATANTGEGSPSSRMENSVRDFFRAGGVKFDGTVPGFVKTHLTMSANDFHKALKKSGVPSPYAARYAARYAELTSSPQLQWGDFIFR